jgi:hypothetical protein
MKLIGLLTEDPRAYFELLEVLREQELRFVTMEFGEPLPANVGVVLTTELERRKVDFDRVVFDHDPDKAVERAKKFLASNSSVEQLLIGIDPGTRPGVAAIGDGVVLGKFSVQSPERVLDAVAGFMNDYPGADTVVRIGNGDRTNRNRIFNRLWDEGLSVEIVDERNTTRRSHTPDEDAAVEIAMTPGYRPRKRQDTEPAPGEIRNIQRISRLESRGRITVSKQLARRVAMGEITLRDAIAMQKDE